MPAITGPDGTPAVETKAQRIRNLARTPGATIEIATDHCTLHVVAVDAHACAEVHRRLQTACQMMGVQATRTYRGMREFVVSW